VAGAVITRRVSPGMSVYFLLLIFMTGFLYLTPRFVTGLSGVRRALSWHRVSP
jgi:hypothetical protein